MKKKFRTWVLVICAIITFGIFAPSQNASAAVVKEIQYHTWDYGVFVYYKSGASYDYIPNIYNSYIKSGSNFNRIRTLQVCLNRLTGADKVSLQEDGKWGPATEAAVRKFQGNHGLGKDGIAGPNTLNQLVWELKRNGSIVYKYLG